MSWGSERSLSVGSYGEATSPSGIMGSPGGMYNRSRAGSTGGSSYHSSSRYSAPQTPTRRSPGMAMMSPKSPSTPSDIIYEYRHDES